MVPNPAHASSCVCRGDGSRPVIKHKHGLGIRREIFPVEFVHFNIAIAGTLQKNCTIVFAPGRALGPVAALGAGDLSQFATFDRINPDEAPLLSDGNCRFDIFATG